MPYAIESDLVPLRISQQDVIGLTDDTGSGQENSAIVTAALEEASGTVDSYCRALYTTPLQASDVVKARTLDIAVYLLFSRRREIKVTETVRQRYVDAIAFLQAVAAGKIQLDQPAGDAPQESTAGPVIADRCDDSGGIVEDHDLRFGDCRLKGYW